MSFDKFVSILGIMILLPSLTTSSSYEFRMDIGDPDNLCPETNYTCPNGKIHFLCKKPARKNPKCICHQELPTPPSTIKAFVRGTNGIRNKVAKQFNIVNMNLLYWSEELETMASKYLLSCKKEVSDGCQIIGDKFLKVSQNTAFMKSKDTDGWAGRVVRHWYMELGPNADMWSVIKHKMHLGLLGNFTNMIYPLAEFMGCSGARYNNGSFIICYYYPAYDPKNLETEFLIGNYACSNCSLRRRMCSRTFYGLCGRDFQINSAPTLYLNIFAFTVFLIAFFVIVGNV